MTNTSSNAKVILIAGHWLGAWAWSDVLAHFGGLKDRTTALTLPGLNPADPDRKLKTLDDQVTAIEQELLAAGEPVVIVAHSGANAPVSLIIDRRPELVRQVIWLDSGPVTSGTAFAPDFPLTLDDLALPAFDELGEQASLEGLDSAQLEEFRARAVSQPGTLLREVVQLVNPARFDIPTTFVCCSMPSAQIKELVQAGHPMFSEVASYKTATFVDLPTGHWPMWSRPAELAQIIEEVSGRA